MSNIPCHEVCLYPQEIAYITTIMPVGIFRIGLTHDRTAKPPKSTVDFTRSARHKLYIRYNRHTLSPPARNLRGFHAVFCSIGRSRIACGANFANKMYRPSPLPMGASYLALVVGPPCVWAQAMRCIRPLIKICPVLLSIKQLRKIFRQQQSRLCATTGNWKSNCTTSSAFCSHPLPCSRPHRSCDYRASRG